MTSVTRRDKFDERICFRSVDLKDYGPYTSIMRQGLACITFWVASIAYVLGLLIFNIIVIPKISRGCVPYNCTYAYVGDASGDQCYTISIPTNASLCLQCYTIPPTNNTACYTPSGEALQTMSEYPSYSCPSRRSCFNMSQYDLFLTVEILVGFFGAVSLFTLGCFIMKNDAS